MTLYVCDIDDALTEGGDPGASVIHPAVRRALNDVCAADPQSVLYATGRDRSIDDVLRRAPGGGTQDDAMSRAPAVFARGAKYRDETGSISMAGLSPETAAFRDGPAREIFDGLIETLRRDPEVAPHISVSRASVERDNNGVLFAFRDHVINIHYGKARQDAHFPPEKLAALERQIENAAREIAGKSPKLLIDGSLKEAFQVVASPAQGFIELTPQEITKAMGVKHVLDGRGFAPGAGPADLVWIADDLKGNDRAAALLIRQYGGEIWQTAYGQNASNVIADPSDPARPDRVFYQLDALAQAIRVRNNSIPMEKRNLDYVS